MDRDQLWLGTMLNGEARWVLTLDTQTVEEARRRHQMTPVATAALGRVMTGTLLMASTMKGAESITVRFLGDGPLGGVVAVGNALGEVRGYVHEPLCDIPLNYADKLDVGAAIGYGNVVVDRSLANGETYTGTVPINTGEVAEDLVYYLSRSEQIPSALMLGVLVGKDHHTESSIGLLIQLLPGAQEETIQGIEALLGQFKGGISHLGKEYSDMDSLLTHFMGDVDYRILDKREVSFKCTCSKDRLADALKLLDKSEIADLVSDSQAEMICHFCNEHYLFDKEELQAIESSKPSHE